MAGLQVDSLLFDFNASVGSQIYDKWQHYLQLLAAQPGLKAVDVVAVESPAPTTTWLIEAKDFRVINNPPKPSNIAGLARTMEKKVLDTQLGLADAAVNAVSAAERSHAIAANGATATRIVLHLEPHVGLHAALFPAGFAANVLKALKVSLNHIDPNVMVLNMANTAAAGVPWTVS